MLKIKTSKIPNSANYANTTFPSLKAVGTSGGPSSYGTYDQLGNIAELIFDTAGPDFLPIVTTSGGFGGNPIVSFSTNLVVRNFYASNTNNQLLESTYRNTSNTALSGGGVGCRISSQTNELSLNNFVLVGDPGNAPHPTGIGKVDYSYYISKYALTNQEYCEFLNAVAKNNSEYYNILNIVGPTNIPIGISRSGSAGNYVYTTKADYELFPVTHLTWEYMARYCNWLHNGKPIGSPSNSTTEDGVYPMYESRNTSTTKKAGAKYYICNENEWYKAAYYKGGGLNAGYWQYPTQSDTPPLPLYNGQILGASINPKIKRA